MAQPSRTVYLGKLSYPEKERFYEFLVANKVEFVAEGEDQYAATIQVVPPKLQTCKISGRIGSAKAGPGGGRSQSADPKSSSRTRAISSNAVPGHKKDVDDHVKAATSCLRKRYSRFCGILPALTKPPKPVGSSSIIRFAEDLYEHRHAQELEYFQRKTSGEEVPNLQPFPNCMLEFAQKRFGLKALVSNNCWAMLSSLELARAQNAHVETFGRFLEETFDSEDLSFFLLVRATIETVLGSNENIIKRSQQKAGQDTDENDVLHGKRAAARAVQNASTNRKKMVFQGYQLDKSQITDAIETALKYMRKKSKALVEAILEKIDHTLMSSESERRMSGQVSPVSQGLDPAQVLLVSTQEYHNSRNIPDKDDENELNFTARLETSTWTPNIPGNLKELDSHVRKEVKQVTKNLIKELVAAGKSEINQQQVFEWALHVVMRRHEIGDFRDEHPDDPVTEMDLDEMIDATGEMHIDPNSPQFGTSSHYEEILEMAPAEFERNLEANVRQLLLYALEQHIGDAIEHLAGAFYDARSRSAVRTKIAHQFATPVDQMMEAVISKDYTAWLRALGVNEKNRSSTHSFQRRKELFQRLHKEFQHAVSQTPVSPEAVHKMCLSMVNVEEMTERIRTCAAKLSRDPSANIADVGNFGGASDRSSSGSPDPSPRPRAVR